MPLSRPLRRSASLRRLAAACALLVVVAGCTDQGAAATDTRGTTVMAASSPPATVGSTTAPGSPAAVGTATTTPATTATTGASDTAPRRALVTAVAADPQISVGTSTITVMAAPGTAAVSGRVHSRPVAFRRDGTAWRATLAGDDLRAGANLVLVTATAGTVTDDASLTVYRLGAAARLGLTLTDASVTDSTGARGVAVTVGLTTGGARQQLSVNGRVLPADTLPARAGRRTVALGAGDGLRAGKNTIAATAVAADGRWQSATLTLTTDSAGPFAEAGATSTGRVGTAVRLDGSGATGTGLTHAWTMRTPAGSRSTLSAATTATPAFTPDRPGSYTLRDVVTAADGRRSADTMVTYVRPYLPPSGTVLDTQVSAGGSLSITRDGTAVVSVPTSATGASMLQVYDRKTLAPLLTASAASPAQVYADEVAPLQQLGLDGDGEGILAVVSVAAGTAGSATALLSALGMTPDAVQASAQAFSLVVATGGASPLVWRSTTTFPAITGVVQPTNGGPGPYTFVPQAHVGYDTSSAATATANTMTVGCPGPLCQTLTSSALSACAGAAHPGGFQVVVLAAASLQVAAQRTFTTNDGCTAAADAVADTTALTAMATFLSGYPAGKDGTVDRIVAVQSIGTPRAVAVAGMTGNWSQVAVAWQAVGLALAPFGGNPTEFSRIGDTTAQGYALLGSTARGLPGAGGQDVQQISADNPNGASARLSGLLTPNNRNDFAPLVSQAGGAINNRLGTVLYQAPTAWKYSQTAGEQKVLAWVTNWGLHDLPQPLVVDPASGEECYDAVLANTFRAAYCNSGLPWSTTIADHLVTLKANPPAVMDGFTLQDWQDVIGELVIETRSLHYAYELVGQLQSPFISSSGGANLHSLIDQVQNSLQPASTDTTDVSTWDAVMSVLFGFLWAALPGSSGQIAGLVSEGFALSGALSQDTTGQPSVQTRVRAAADDLVSELSSRYKAVSVNMLYLQDMLVTDPSKLAAAVASVQTDGITSDTMAEPILALHTAAQGWLYSGVLAAIYRPNRLMESNPAGSYGVPFRPYLGDASTFTCFQEYLDQYLNPQYLPYQPYTGSSVAAQYQAVVASAAGAPLATNYVLAQPGTIHDGTKTVTRLGVAPGAILRQLFAPAEIGDNASAGLGIDPDDFFGGTLDLAAATVQACQTSRSVPGSLAAAASSADGQTVFFTGTFGSASGLTGVHYSALTGTWQGLPVLAGTPDAGSALAAASAGQGDLHVFFVSKGQLNNDWYTPQDGWSGPGGLPGSPDKGSPLAAVMPNTGSMYLFFLHDGKIQYDQYTGGAWTGPLSAPGSPDKGSPLAAVTSGSGNINVFYLTKGTLQNIWSVGGGAWQGPGLLPGTPDRSNRLLAASSWGPGDAHVYFSTKGAAQNVWYTNTGWQGPGPIPAKATRAGLAAASAPGPVPPALYYVASNAAVIDTLYAATWTPTGGWQPAYEVLGPNG